MINATRVTTILAPRCEGSDKLGNGNDACDVGAEFPVAGYVVGGSVGYDDDGCDVDGFVRFAKNGSEREVTGCSRPSGV